MDGFIKIPFERKGCYNMPPTNRPTSVITLKINGYVTIHGILKYKI